ncbi:UNVERIFIED_CONTAM: hypothetical protein FKN15_005584 [Acipenser sinensis]
MELMPDKKKVSDKPNRKLKLNAEKVEGHVLDPLALPVVGSWEFECDDDEYVRFLELFLSYMLEKGLVNNQDSGIPFLACFSSHLREHELNSLLFDVHTTLKRRQNQKGSSNIFRAGSCYHLVPGPPPAPLGKPVSVHSETWSAQSSLRPSSSMADPSETNLNANQYFPGAHKGKQKGLFGLRRQPSSPPRQDGSPESMPTPRYVSLYSQSTCDPLCATPRTPQTEAYVYKALLPKHVDPPVDELTPELQSRFRLTGRLLEWMIRWSDRRLLCGPSKAQRLLEYSTVIRVKASAPAILNSLWMLERRYSAGLLVDKHLHSRGASCDEYVRFLELFLSYMLEKGLVNNQDSGIPFLACFSSHLREHELNSLLFDVHTTLKRRQNQKGSSNIFRAGSCYHLVPGPPPAPLGKPVSVHSETWSAQSSLRPSSSMADPSETNLNANQYFPGAHKGKQKGLFGLRRQPSSPPRQDGSPESMPTPRYVSLYSQSTCDPLCATPRTPQTEAYVYKALLPKHVDPPVDELTPELQSRFRLTGRLLEWMIRWSDRRLLCGPSKAQRLLEYSTVIRVKASAPAILNSLWMLERRYSAGLLVDKHLHSRVPEREYIVAPVFQQEPRSKVERESSVDTGYPSSAETPITLLDQEIFESQHGHDSDSVTGGDPSPAFRVQFHTPDPKSGLSATTVPIETGEPQRREPNTQPLANSEAVRQMLQDEMFRLVQLQQINFMSLMQVVGSSFMNLPNAQQNLQEAQPNQMNGNQPLNLINERPRQSTGVQHREPALCNQQQSYLEKHTGSSKNLNADDQSNKENIAQNPPPLILHLDPPQSQPESEGLIPASRGLLTTSPNKRRVQLLVPPSDTQQTPTLIPLEKTSGRAKGLQLLKLQPSDQFKLAAPSVKPFISLPQGSAQFFPQPREAWALSSLSSQPENNPRIHPHWKRSGPPSHLNLSQYDPEALRRAEEEKARQKRRIEKRQEGKKAIVIFRPENSIILPKEKEVTEPSRSQLGEGFVIPPDFDIMAREAHVSTEDVLDLTGLSDVADILGDLVNDGGISATELGLLEVQARRLPSTGKARGRGPDQAPTRTEKERQEIREWMKRKQQQRLAEYRKQREHNPLKAGTATINLTSKDIKVNNKIKEEKKKMVLSDHNSQRAMEALNLMNEMLSDTVPLPTAELNPLADTPLKSFRSQGQRSARG